MIYFSILLFVCILGLIPSRNQERWAYGVLFAMFLLCGLRGDSVCVDTQHYINIIKSNDLENLYGFIYGLIGSFCKWFGDSPHIVLFVFAMLTYIPLFMLIRKASLLPVLSVAVFMVSSSLFLETFNLVRQSIALMFILWAMYYLDKCKNFKDKKFVFLILLFVFIAYQFHKVAILAAPFFIFAKLNIEKRKVYIILFLSFLTGLTSQMVDISEYLTYLTNLQSYEETGSFARTFGSYAFSEEYIGQWGIMGKLVNALPMNLLCLATYNKQTKGNTYFNLTFFGVVFLNLFVSSTFCIRISTILTISQLLLVPIAFKTSGKKQQLYIYGVLGLMAFLYVYKLIGYMNSPQSLGVLPYSFCF